MSKETKERDVERLTDLINVFAKLTNENQEYVLGVAHGIVIARGGGK